MTIVLGILAYFVVVLFTLGLVGATRRSKDRGTRSVDARKLLADLSSSPVAIRSGDRQMATETPGRR